MKVKCDIIDGPLPQCKFSTSAKKQNVIYLENVQNKPSARPRNTVAACTHFHQTDSARSFLKYTGLFCSAPHHHFQGELEGGRNCFWDLEDMKLLCTHGASFI